MPELPEVETVRCGLQRLLVGRRISEVEALSPGSFQAAPADISQHVVGATVTAARRLAKVLMIDLDNDYSLVAHLKMTGQLVIVADGGASGERWGGGHPNDSLVDRLPDRSTRVIITLDDGAARLFFNDQRKFGWMKVMPTADVGTLDFIAQLGPEPLDGDPTPEFLRRIRHHQATTVKAAILNQTVIAGIGNIYADESCWVAQVHPASRVGDLNDRQLKAILNAAIDVMTTSINLGGSTDRNYVDAEGHRGAYLGFAKVFRREGQPCQRCGTTIIKTRVAGRGTHLCPHCQRL
ncbi:MAG: bifunctional DNA-formamidopyrimidine glycosylase/DNA-(apurinic or apyrimidinic site) lyase [Propionibacteriaceae bacterium]|jgi:formamidopyrimidine-DNA glycosylase|nr:bifunctional DNA-formamidopyrimidine glycosylase/DNA-(apurinic or apyrimidinic site) lyase [Propionibacteriaceae bacterium]